MNIQSILYNHKKTIIISALVLLALFGAYSLLTRGVVIVDKGDYKNVVYQPSGASSTALDPQEIEGSFALLKHGAYEFQFTNSRGVKSIIHTEVKPFLQRVDVNSIAEQQQNTIRIAATTRSNVISSDNEVYYSFDETSVDLLEHRPGDSTGIDNSIKQIVSDNISISRMYKLGNKVLFTASELGDEADINLFSYDPSTDNVSQVAIPITIDSTYLQVLPANDGSFVLQFGDAVYWYSSVDTTGLLVDIPLEETDNIFNPRLGYSGGVITSISGTKYIEPLENEEDAEDYVVTVPKNEISIAEPESGDINTFSIENVNILSVIPNKTGDRITVMTDQGIKIYNPDDNNNLVFATPLDAVNDFEWINDETAIASLDVAGVFMYSDKTKSIHSVFSNENISISRIFINGESVYATGFFVNEAAQNKQAFRIDINTASPSANTIYDSYPAFSQYYSAYPLDNFVYGTIFQYGGSASNGTESFASESEVRELVEEDLPIDYSVRFAE